MNTTWQPYQKTLNLTDIPAGNNTYLFGTMTPGVGAQGSIDPFDDDHVLERIRGRCAHALDFGSVTNEDRYWPVVMAGLKVPAEFVDGLSIGRSTTLDVWNTEKGEDYFFWCSGLCNPQDTTNGDNLANEMIDNKAKRRFNSGDAIAWLLGVANPTNITTIDINVAMNFRLLWKLR